MLSKSSTVVKMPGKPKRERVISYIDGFNLYFGMRDAGLKRHLWLDLVSLSRNLLMDFQDLIVVKYFTSRISGPGAKQQRQSTYLDALKTLDPAVFTIYYGKYQDEPQTCRHCLKEDTISHEKMTDVNIAVEMMRDGFENRFDTALLLSADADLCPPVRAIRTLYKDKRVVVGFPPARRSAELQAVASNCFVIGHGSLGKSQFANQVNGHKGIVLVKPPTWI